MALLRLRVTPSSQSRRQKAASQEQLALGVRRIYAGGLPGDSGLPWKRQEKRARTSPAVCCIRRESERSPLALIKVTALGAGVPEEPPATG